MATVGHNALGWALGHLGSRESRLDVHPIYWICVDELAVSDVVGARRGSHQGICKTECISRGGIKVAQILTEAHLHNHVRIRGYVSRYEAIQLDNEPMKVFCGSG